MTNVIVHQSTKTVNAIVLGQKEMPSDTARGEKNVMAVGTAESMTTGCLASTTMETDIVEGATMNTEVVRHAVTDLLDGGEAVGGTRTGVIRQYQKERHLYPRENAKHLGGTSTLRATNNTQLCRPSKQVSLEF